MARKKSVKKSVVKKEVHVAPPRRRLNPDKADGIMAIMSAVLVLLIAILNPLISAIVAIVLMVLFSAYKLLKR